MTPGIVVVAAMTSLKRKSGYSCWGPHIAVTAPSNNMHYITSFVQPGSDPRRDDFVADYRGLGQAAAANRPGHGAAFTPLSRFDDPTTPDLVENFYTVEFGGTSGAAPVVTGIVALMLAANPDLTANQVRQILMGTADKNLDPALDLHNDPNVQGLTGEFVNGRSRWFGAGKVNAFRAVSRARALANDNGGDTPSSLDVEVRPSLSIPDNQPEGVVSIINISAAGKLAEITVHVEIDHPYRGDLQVSLISPQGLIAELHRSAFDSTDNLNRSFTPRDTPDLANLVNAAVDINGRWILHVADRMRRDTGTLQAWRLMLEV